MTYAVSLSTPNGGSVSLTTADAHLLAEYLWRLAKPRGILGGDGAHLAGKIVDALVGDRSVAVDLADVPALILALERLAMALRLTSALRSLQSELE